MGQTPGKAEQEASEHLGLTWALGVTFTLVCSTREPWHLAEMGLEEDDS